MAQRDFRILVVLLLIFPLRIFSQQQLPLVGKNPSHLLKQKDISVGVEDLKPSVILKSFQPQGELFWDGRDLLLVEGTPFKNYRILTIISGDYCPSTLSFICKKEMQFEKLTKIPLRFRLGSLEYVNRLEGKENWIGAGLH